MIPLERAAATSTEDVIEESVCDQARLEAEGERATSRTLMIIVIMMFSEVENKTRHWVTIFTLKYITCKHTD
jgi:hypothetical protein